MFYGEEAIKNIKNIVFEDAMIDETPEQSVNEAWFFISKDAKALKAKIKEAIKQEFSAYNSKGFGDRLKGAFTGENSSQVKQAFSKALSKVTALVGGKSFGPCMRTRSYTVGNTTYTETYYIYVIYGILKDKVIKVEMESGTSSFTFHENDSKIPLSFVKEIINTAGSNTDLLITKNSVSCYQRNAMLKDKKFANEILAKAEKAGIPAKLDIFKSTVKF